MREEDDFGFIRNFLDRELAEKLDLFVYEARQGDEIRSPTATSRRCARRSSRPSSTTARRASRPPR